MEKLSNDVLEEISEYLISDDLLRLHCTGDKKLQYRMSKCARRATIIYPAFKDYTGMRYVSNISHHAECKIILSITNSVCRVTIYTICPLRKTEITIQHYEVSDFVKNSITTYQNMEIVLVAIALNFEYHFSNPTECVELFKHAPDFPLLHNSSAIYSGLCADMNSITRMECNVEEDLCNFPLNVTDLTLYVSGNHTIDISKLKYLRKIHISGLRRDITTVNLPSHAISFKHSYTNVIYSPSSRISEYNCNISSLDYTRHIPVVILQKLSPQVLTEFNYYYGDINASHIQLFINLKTVIVYNVYMDAHLPASLTKLSTNTISGNDKYILSQYHNLLDLVCSALNVTHLPPNLTKLSTGNVCVNDVPFLPQSITRLSITIDTSRSRSKSDICEYHEYLIRTAINNVSNFVTNLNISLTESYLGKPLDIVYSKNLHRIATPYGTFVRNIDGDMEKLCRK